MLHIMTTGEAPILNTDFLYLQECGLD